MRIRDHLKARLSHSLVLYEESDDIFESHYLKGEICAFREMLRAIDSEVMGMNDIQLVKQHIDTLRELEQQANARKKNPHIRDIMDEYALLIADLEDLRGVMALEELAKLDQETGRYDE